MNFFGNTITPKGLLPEADKIKKVLETVKLPATVRQVRKLVTLFCSLVLFLPNLARNFKPRFNLFPKIFLE